jgi:hypothetical protein
MTFALSAPANAAATPAAKRDGAVRYTAGQAAPSSVHLLSGWLGTCYPEVHSTSGGGWCDGNGPDWHYYGWVDCSNGWEYYGVDRWAGDRRKSFGYCPSGTYAVAGGVDAYYAG